MARVRDARIRIEQNTDSSVDAQRDPVPVWSLVQIAWASVTPVSGSERFDTQQMAAEVTHQIELDYIPNITAKMRALWNGRTFDFQSVINVDARNRDLVILAVEQA